MIESFEQFFSFLSVSQDEKQDFCYKEKENAVENNIQSGGDTEKDSYGTEDDFQFFHDWMMEERGCKFCQPVIDSAMQMGELVKTVYCSHCGASYRYNLLMNIWERRSV